MLPPLAFPEAIVDLIRGCDHIPRLCTVILLDRARNQFEFTRAHEPLIRPNSGAPSRIFCRLELAMRFKIYSELNGRAAVEYRETAEGAVLRADWLIDRGAAGVVIWDEQTSDRVYPPWQFEELITGKPLSPRRRMNQ